MNTKTIVTYKIPTDGFHIDTSKSTFWKFYFENLDDFVVFADRDRHHTLLLLLERTPHNERIARASNVLDTKEYRRIRAIIERGNAEVSLDERTESGIQAPDPTDYAYRSDFHIVLHETLARLNDHDRNVAEQLILADKADRLSQREFAETNGLTRYRVAQDYERILKLLRDIFGDFF